MIPSSLMISLVINQASLIVLISSKVQKLISSEIKIRVARDSLLMLDKNLKVELNKFLKEKVKELKNKPKLEKKLFICLLYLIK